MQLNAVGYVKKTAILLSESQQITQRLKPRPTPRATPWQETYLAQKHFRKTETTKMYLHASQNSPQTTNFSYIKQYSNQSGLTIYNSGIRFPLPTYKS
jgi:hypothetical protein